MVKFSNFRPQIADGPEILSVVMTPKPVSLPLSYSGTELTLPMYGSGLDLEHNRQQITWMTGNLYAEFNLVNFAGGVTLYRKVIVTGTVRFDDTPKESPAVLGLSRCTGVSPATGDGGSTEDIIIPSLLRYLHTADL